VTERLPIEDIEARLRRTFATRAGDVDGDTAAGDDPAAGDDEEWPPLVTSVTLAGAPGRRSLPRRRALLAGVAAVTLPILAGAVYVARTVRTPGAEHTHRHEAPPATADPRQDPTTTTTICPPTPTAPTTTAPTTTTPTAPKGPPHTFPPNDRVSGRVPVDRKVIAKACDRCAAKVAKLAEAAGIATYHRDAALFSVEVQAAADVVDRVDRHGVPIQVGGRTGTYVLGRNAAGQATDTLQVPFGPLTILVQGTALSRKEIVAIAASVTQRSDGVFAFTPLPGFTADC
jgi:hypothetical protein